MQHLQLSSPNNCLKVKTKVFSYEIILISRAFKSKQLTRFTSIDHEWNLQYTFRATLYDILYEEIVPHILEQPDGLVLIV